MSMLSSSMLTVLRARRSGKSLLSQEWILAALYLKCTKDHFVFMNSAWLDGIIDEERR